MATVIQTIKQQIGTDTWLAVSARSESYFISESANATLKFRFGNRYGLPNYIEIEYRAGSDDYALRAYRIHRNGCKSVLADYEGVYADSLAFLIRDINQEAQFA